MNHPEPIAYLDQQYVPQSQAALPIHDLGIVGGLAVSEMLRTFDHELLFVDQHLERLGGSLAAVHIGLNWSADRWHELINRVVDHNVGLVEQGVDLGVILFVTAGWNPTYVGRAAALAHGPTVGIHTFPLHQELWKERLIQGASLVSVRGRVLPASVVPPVVKSRSRLHWSMADHDARRVDPHAQALLIGDEGTVTETATSNVIAVIDRQLISPPPGVVLEGIALTVTLNLGSERGLNVVRRQLTLSELVAADEVLLTSTPTCVLPATRLDGNPIGLDQPGPVCRELRAAWSELAGLDLDQQILGT